MNDNQYLAHGAIVCHSGVKGMKWGKHIKSAGEWIDKNITGASAKANRDRALAEEAYARSQRSIAEHNRMFGGGNPSMREYQARLSQGSYNAEKAANAKAYSSQKKYDQSLAGKAEKSYKVVKTKAGKIFGKAKTFFGKPRLSKIERKR